VLNGYRNTRIIFEKFMTAKHLRPDPWRALQLTGGNQNGICAQACPEPVEGMTSILARSGFVIGNSVVRQGAF